MPAPGYETEIAALEAAAASGELTVETSNGDRITYRSASDLFRALTYFRGLRDNPISPGGRPLGTTVAAYCPD